MDKAEFNQYVEDIPKPEYNTNSVGRNSLNPDALWRSTKENLKLTIGVEAFNNAFSGSYIENISN